MVTLSIVRKKGSMRPNALLPSPSLSFFIQASTQAQGMIFVTFKGLLQTSITVTKIIPSEIGSETNTVLVIAPRFARGLSAK